jgi:hypothetical protein
VTPPRRPTASKAPATARSEHRFEKSTSVINGITRTTYTCPCGRFADDGLKPGHPAKLISEAEARRRYQTHLAL